MADITQTAANVHPNGDSVRIAIVQVGEAVVQGDVAYRLATDSKHYKAESGDTSVEADAVGMFLTPAALDGYAVIQYSGPIDIGGTLVKGQSYFVSATAGKVMPESDIATGNFVTRLGVASAADKLLLAIDPTGIDSA